MMKWYDPIYEVYYWANPGSTIIDNISTGLGPFLNANMEEYFNGMLEHCVNHVGYTSSQ